MSKPPTRFNSGLMRSRCRLFGLRKIRAGPDQGDLIANTKFLSQTAELIIDRIGRLVEFCGDFLVAQALGS